jgi:L-2-hydroxyglutarate oxidase
MTYDVAVVGGGIVGLASAYHLLLEHPTIKLVVLEKEELPAQHQTGHNSGVIHSGIYYKPGSLKARNCIEGYHMLLEFAKDHNIPYDLCGKIIVATEERELKQLEAIYQRGVENGLEGLEIIDSEGIKAIEPHCAGIRAIVVPQTGIIDYKEICYAYKQEILSRGGAFLSSFKVDKLWNKDDYWSISGSGKNVMAKYLVNCAGLYSDKVAELAVGKTDTKIIPFRGEYYMLKPESHHLVNNLIYPVPDPNFPFLGVHFTRMMNGHIEAGPNAVLAFRREGYRKRDIHLGEFFESLMWPGFQKVAAKYWKTGLGEMYRSFSKRAFTKALQKLIPEITADDLQKADAGVRAQACHRDGGLLDDFSIIEEERGIHVINAPSPAATSSLAIGKSIAGLLKKQLSKA